MQLDTTGVVATAFDHYDSRANDPHLHPHVVISNKGTDIVGIISERDVTRAVATEADPCAVTASQYASKHLEVALLNDEVQRVAQRMLEAGVRHLPVMEDSELVGMISMRDLLAVETWG